MAQKGEPVRFCTDRLYVSGVASRAAANVSNANNERYVTATGSFDNNNANNTYAVRPGLVETRGK